MKLRSLPDDDFGHNGTAVKHVPRVAPRVCIALLALAMLSGNTIASAGGQREQGSVPETHWCPMHPDIRGAAGERCRLCSMALVPITAVDYEPYLLDVEVKPRALRAGQKSRLRFAVRDPHSGRVVRRFATVHERVFHLFILSDDHRYFAHVHPELKADGRLEVDVEFPRAGAYRLIADFAPEGGTPQFMQRALVTAGYSGSLIARGTLDLDLSTKTIGNSSVGVTMPDPVAGREQLITFDVHDALTSAPAQLEPYLGATGHLLVVSADLNIAFHSHPVDGLSTLTGPTVVFQVLFPRAGNYKLWAQFQRGGQVITAPFQVSVSARE